MLLDVAEEGGIQMNSLTSSSSFVKALPPQWVDDVDAVNAELTEIIRMMDVLQSLHSSRVGSVFGKDLDDMEGRIEKMTQDVTGMYRGKKSCIGTVVLVAVVVVLRCFV